MIPMNPNVVLCVVAWFVTLSIGVVWYLVDGVYIYDQSMITRYNRVTGDSCPRHYKSGPDSRYYWQC